MTNLIEQPRVHPEIARAEAESAAALERLEEIRLRRAGADERVHTLRRKRGILAARITRLEARDCSKLRASYDAVVVELLDSVHVEETITRRQELNHALSSLGQLAEVERLLPSVLATAKRDLAECERALKEIEA